MNVKFSMKLKSVVTNSFITIGSYFEVINMNN